MWRTETALSNKAAKHYAALAEGLETHEEFDSAVYAFHSQLIDLYPALDMLPEGEEERSPWAFSPEFSGDHVLIALRPEYRSEAFPVILLVAEFN